MIDLNWTRCTLPPFAHQETGVRELVKWDDPAHGRTLGGVFGLFDEMGAGKTKQVIDASCFLHEMKDIDTVLVWSPASVRSVWLGAELDKHAFLPVTRSEYHARSPQIQLADRQLNYVVTNFEFMRDERRFKDLAAQLKDRRVWMVVDESSRIKGHRSIQTKAALKFGRLPFVRRRTILNGTPIANNALDLYAQINFLHPDILGVQNFYHFRARYAIIAGPFKKVIGWQNMEELQRKIQPYVLRRLKRDCLDLPDKLYMQREVALTPSAWKLYCEMRDDAVANIGPLDQVIAPQAVVRLLRLSQITSGFLGGVEQARIDPELNFDDAAPMLPLAPTLREVDRAKLDALLELWDDLSTDGVNRLLVWCRFRAEIERANQAFRDAGVEVHNIIGGQSRDERAAAVDRFMSNTTAPVVLLGTPGAGGLGLTLTSAHHVVYLSNDYNLVTRLQSEDRVHRPGQVRNVSYFDILATGPKGQKTIDHAIRKAIMKKDNMASWTADAWRRALTEE